MFNSVKIFQSSTFLLLKCIRTIINYSSYILKEQETFNLNENLNVDLFSSLRCYLSQKENKIDCCRMVTKGNTRNKINNNIIFLASLSFHWYLIE